MKVSFTDIVMSLLAAPGTVARQYFRKLACDVSGVPVSSMSYFVMGDNAPPMELAKVDKKQMAMIILLPLFGNTFLGVALMMAPLTGIYFLGDLSFSLDQWLFFWLGLSLCVNALPTFADAKILQSIPEEDGTDKWARAITFLGQIRRYWADFLYAALAGLSVPYISIWVLNNIKH